MGCFLSCKPCHNSQAFSIYVRFHQAMKFNGNELFMHQRCTMQREAAEKELEMQDVKERATIAIQIMVDKETTAWDRCDVDALLSIFHPDMVWPFPPTPADHDPINWLFVLGRYCPKRWRENWQGIFDSHDLIHNHRSTIKILPTEEGDGGMAVVDADTLWRHKKTGKDFHWKGRSAKIYVRRKGDWKMIFQHGLLDFEDSALSYLASIAEQ